jgi:hypothetical protein
MGPALSDLITLLPGDPDIVQPLVALALSILLYAAAWGLARLAAPRLRRRLPPLGDALAGHVRAVTRHGFAAALLALALPFFPSGSLGHLIVGIALGSAVALLATHILRGLAIPRWAVVPLALILFILIVSGSGGGIAPVSEMLDGIGMNLGKRRITLLGLLSIASTPHRNCWRKSSPPSP